MENNYFEKLVSFGDIQRESGGYLIPMTIHKDHEVFTGHFPGQPVMPGVVTMEILRRAVGMVTEKEVRLQKAANVKFLGMIDPTTMSDLVLELNAVEAEGLFKVKANIAVAADGRVVYKQQATYHAN